MSQPNLLELEAPIKICGAPTHPSGRRRSQVAPAHDAWPVCAVQVTYTVSTRISFGCLSTGASHLKPTISFWATTWTAASRAWRRFACCSRIRCGSPSHGPGVRWRTCMMHDARSAKWRTFFTVLCLERNRRSSIRKTSSCCAATTSARRSTEFTVSTTNANGATTSGCGKRSQTASTACRWPPWWMKRWGVTGWVEKRAARGEPPVCGELASVFEQCTATLPTLQILCMHGGLSPELKSLEQIKRIPRPTDVPDTGLLCDLLWADPDKDVQASVLMRCAPLCRTAVRQHFGPRRAGARMTVA